MHPSEELEHQLTRWSYSQMKKTEKQTIAQIQFWPSDRHTTLSKATISTTSTNQPSSLAKRVLPPRQFLLSLHSQKDSLESSPKYPMAK